MPLAPMQGPRKTEWKEKDSHPNSLKGTDGEEERAAQTIVSRISSFIFFRQASFQSVGELYYEKEIEGALATNKKEKGKEGRGAKMTVRRPRNDVEEIERRGRRKHLISHDIGDFL